MAIRLGGSLDLTQFALIGAMLHPVSADPSGLGTGDKGRIWFNTTSNRLKVWDGTSAIDLLDLSAATGTLTAAKISDFTTAVQAIRWSSMLGPNADVSIGGNKLTNVTDPSGNQDAATKNYVDTQLAGLTSGQVLKGSVKVASTVNVNLSAPGANVDGVAMSNGDIFLATAQTTGSQNGPYVYNGSAVAATRALNWDTSGEAVLGSYWIVQQGTNADTFALLTNDSAITLGTTTPTFVFRGAAGASYTDGLGIGLAGTVFSVAAGTGLTQQADGLALDTAVAVRKVGGAVPATTSGIFTVSGQNVTVNHGLNNDTPDVTCVAGSSPVAGFTTDQPVIVDWVRVDANNIMITFPGTLAANQWRVGVRG